jgi:hypothetical protein
MPAPMIANEEAARNPVGAKWTLENMPAEIGKKIRNAGRCARVFHSAGPHAVLKLTYPFGAPAP